MRIGALFAGYGGLDIAASEIFGGRLAWYSEIEKGALKVLGHRFPDAPNVGDVTAVNWSQVEPVDILTGGSPCQDLSHAGRRAGMTEGTRSNLWVAMREAIAQLRPRTVVWENVRGAFSAAADSEVEPCPGCVGDGSGVHLRALGRVLGDLSDLGYDTRWHGLRAADIGAPHGRFRVFVVATDTTSDTRGVAHGDGGVATDARRLRGRPGRTTGPAEATGRGPLGDIAGRRLMPTPRATDGTKGGPGQRGSSGDLMLPSAVALLPTPAAHEPGGTAEQYHERLRQRDGRDSTFLPLGMAVKEIAHASSTEERSSEVLSDVRDRDNAEEVRERSLGGPECVPETPSLLAELCEHEGDGAGGLSPLAGASDQAAESVRGVRGDPSLARAPHRQERDQQPPEQSVGAVPVVSSSPALGGGSRRPDGIDFGPYTAAVERWETVLGRPAPSPTEPGRNGKPRLSPRFCEFLMGLPDGWITDVPGITRNEALKACGNGVVPQQAAAALHHMLTRQEAAA